MQAALEVHEWDVVICDYSMPCFDGPAALAIYRQQGLDIPFIGVSGTVGEENVAEMMKAGAHDYVMKGNLARLVPVVKRELRAAQEQRNRREAGAVSAYLAAIVQSCDDAIIGKTLDGTVVSWNRGAERIYGYSAAEMIGRSVSVLIPSYRPAELPEIYETIKTGRRGGRTGNGAHPERWNTGGGFADHLADQGCRWAGGGRFDGGAGHYAPEAGG